MDHLPAYKDKNRLINYIKNQQEHLRKVTFEEEYRIQILESGMKIEGKFFP